MSSNKAVPRYPIPKELIHFPSIAFALNELTEATDMDQVHLHPNCYCTEISKEKLQAALPCKPSPSPPSPGTSEGQSGEQQPQTREYKYTGLMMPSGQKKEKKKFST